ncbi:MAG: tetratricopeptide repeat protein [Candidatus Obscuribacterales bacterium]|nr:tetratricopeptide repeat protein [Candidatus Obscuribacterales bacterium]
MNKTWLISFLSIFVICTVTGCSKEKPTTDKIIAVAEPAAPVKEPTETDADYFKRDMDVNSKEGLKALQNQEYEKAERLLLVALQQVDAYRGQEARTAMILNNLASVYEAKEMYAQAIPLLNRAQKLFIRAYGTKNPAVAITLGNMGRVLMKQKRFMEASQVYSTAVNLMQENPQRDNAQYKDMLGRYLESLRLSGRGAAANAAEEKLRALR